MKGTWIDEKDPHALFQVDISCMLDGELDEAAAARAMLHIEECTGCRAFFEDVRMQVRLHQDVRDPDRLLARVAMLTGSGEGAAELGLPFALPFGLPSLEALEEEAVRHELVQRLATVFYQLGKAYVLAAIDPGFRTRVFEAALPIDETKNAGRGFVDGVVLSGKGAEGVDWQQARHMLNGRLERIESPLEKGRRLLEEALAADPSHEEARLYRAFLHAHEGKVLQAAVEYRQVFRSAIQDANRGHAAMQLGKLHEREKDYRKCIVCFRWVVASGLDARDDRFFGARFNLGTAYAMLGQKARALAEFRALLDRHPARLAEVIQLFARAPRLQEAIDRVPGFPEELLATCPELFSLPSTGGVTEV